MPGRAVNGQSKGGRTEALVPVVPVRDAVHFPAFVNTLHVARDLSLRALRKSLDGDRLVVVLSQRDMALDDPGPNDLYPVGTLSEVLQSIPLPDTTQRAALRGIRRVRVVRMAAKGGSLWAEVEPLVEVESADLETEAMMRTSLDSFTRIVHLNSAIPPEALQNVVHLENPGLLADAILHHAPLKPADKQALLQELDHKTRLEGLVRLLKREEQVLMLNEQIHQRVQRELGEGQREFYLREQLRIIQNELREREDRVGEIEEYAEKIRAAKMPEAVETAAMSEVRRLDRAPIASPEGLLSRNYLDTLVSLPWAVTTEDTLDVLAAERLLEERHFGLHRVKDRILDHLAVRQLKRSLRGPILCFVGPPGVGKTSIGRSIAEAMGRRFLRISLGGIRDEAEIRGHRRTYVGSMPGRIIQGLRECGARNPVIVLDEIDKIGGQWQGDPASALLEALDPEQNVRFVDHYIEAPFDLSAVLFVATANLLENIPAPLRDRMEVISFPSYTDHERVEIARRYLLPRSLAEHGLEARQMELPDSALCRLVQDYTREAGVRSLARLLATLCRKVAREIASGLAERVVLDDERLVRYLGHPRFKRSAIQREDEVGTAWAMVVSEVGGEVVPTEVSLIPKSSGRGELRLTGNLGDVMKESAQTALTAVRERLPDLADKVYDVHVHVPEGAIPKDGPSAGATIACALYSALQGRALRGDTAMTGEITLRGRILPVGGVPEKLLAAHRAGLRRVVLPKENETDLDELPDDVRAALEVSLVGSLEEALRSALA